MGDFCLLIYSLAEMKGWDPGWGGACLGNGVYITLGPPWAWQRRAEYEKGSFLCPSPSRMGNAGTGNAQRFSAVYWMPNRQIWKAAFGVLKR